MSRRRRLQPRRLARILAAAALVGIVVLSVVPGKWVPRPPYPFKPYDHALAYFGAAVPLAFAYHGARVRFLMVAAFSGIAAMFEIIQILIATRQASLWDFSSSACGALVGTTFGSLLSVLWTALSRVIPASAASSTKERSE